VLTEVLAVTTAPGGRGAAREVCDWIVATRTPGGEPGAD
jgi:3-deoxy-D-manno-octulosonate 8-phosphate phosphatase KdsC-like HAD superfamily phosphatase